VLSWTQDDVYHAQYSLGILDGKVGGRDEVQGRVLQGGRHESLAWRKNLIIASL
jgi:hypothetical protein